jgi:hypothetical protein
MSIATHVYCAQDTRYDETSIATHDRQLLPAVSATTLSHLTCRARDYDVIGRGCASAIIPFKHICTGGYRK